MKVDDYKKMMGHRETHKFSVGDKVIFINCYGVNWGEKTIIECIDNPVRGNTYKYEPTDTPWYDVEEHLLFAPGDPAIQEKTLVTATHEGNV